MLPSRSLCSYIRGDAERSSCQEQATWVIRRRNASDPSPETRRRQRACDKHLGRLVERAALHDRHGRAVRVSVYPVGGGRVPEPANQPTCSAVPGAVQFLL